MLTSEITIRPMRTPADAQAFRTLNEAWIRPLFGMEPADSATLDDPFGAIVARGGAVLMAFDNDHAVGCVSLLPAGDGVFELSKMTVQAPFRGRGIGRMLIDAAVDRARDLGATKLVLASNSRLAPAIALYESAGFRHVAPEPSPYARANVFMELDL